MYALTPTTASTHVAVVSVCDCATASGGDGPRAKHRSRHREGVDEQPPSPGACGKVRSITWRITARQALTHPVFSSLHSFELSWPEWLASLFDMQDSTSSASGSVFSLDCVLDDHDHVPAIFQEIMLFTAGPLILFALAALFWFCVHPRLYRQHVHRHRQQHETRVKQLAQHGKHVHDADAELKRLKRHWAADPKGHRVERFTVTVIIIFFLLQVRLAVGV